MSLNFDHSTVKRPNNSHLFLLKVAIVLGLIDLTGCAYTVKVGGPSSEIKPSDIDKVLDVNVKSENLPFKEKEGLHFIETRPVDPDLRETDKRTLNNKKGLLD